MLLPYYYAIYSYSEKNLAASFFRVQCFLTVQQYSKFDNDDDELGSVDGTP